MQRGIGYCAEAFCELDHVWVAKRNKRHSDLCGQAPSDYQEFAEFLVKEGIDSISLNPDSGMKITLKVFEIERKL